MKIRLFNRKSIVFLFAIAVFFCSVQSLSFGQVELIVSDPASLTEATLDNSIVTLTLRGAAFAERADTIRGSLSVSGVSGVSVDDVSRISDTEISVRLRFRGDFDQDATLTFAVQHWGIIGQAGSTLTDPISVTSTVESLTATPASLTEATLHNSTVRLTLRGRTFEDNVDTIRRNLSVSGVSGVSVADVGRHSDTEITVGLEFSGNLERDGTLTFRVGFWGIKNYGGSVLTDEISVTSTVESLTASPVSLTEATLHNSTVTLTLRGRTFEDNVNTIRNLSVSGISGLRVDDIRRLSDTEVSVRLEFSGDLDRDATLRFGVGSGGIKGYNRDLTANIPVTTLTESLTASPASLTEATLNNSTVTLTLRGRTFENNIRPYVSVSGISGLRVDDIRRHSDTEVTVRLESNRDFNRDATLTFRVRAGGIKNYNRDLTTDIPVTTLTESLTTSPVSLTEATLHNSTVTLTLRGRTFEENIGRSSVSVSGISGVSVDDVGHLSDTEIRVRLEFSGDLDRDATLTFRVRAGGIKNYNRDLTTDIPVTTSTESLTASPASLTEATLNNSTVTLTLRGRTFENNIRPYVSVSGISGVNVGNLRLLSSTEVGVPLNFNGDFDRDGTLTFRVRSGGIKNYNGSDLTANIPVSATIETQTPVAPTPIPNPTPQPPTRVVSIPDPTVPNTNVGTTPQPSVVRIPNVNLRAEIQRVIGNTITTQTLLNLTTLDASDLGITNLTGLEHATNLSELYLLENNISDVSPLSGLTQLTVLDLYDNNISDISQLVGLTRLTELYLTDNPLNAAAITTHIPTLQARGTEVEFDNRAPTTPPPVEVENPPVDTRTPTVPIDPSQPAIYLEGGDGIQRANLDGSNVQTLVKANVQTLLERGGPIF